MTYFAGIDSGSTACKAVLVKDSIVLDEYICKTGWNPRGSAAQALEYLLRSRALGRENVRVAATGYGRGAVDFAECAFTEITCHALGALALEPDICGVVDIGGQDSKVIRIENGRVADFLMNDKCAAGTGRFLSMACDALGLELQEVDAFADLSEPEQISSMCTVFAETEIIGLIAMQKDRAKILSGVLRSIAQKLRQMTVKLDFPANAPLLMTGGLSRSNALVRMLSETTGLKIITHGSAVFAGALGACICADKKSQAGD